MHWNCHTYFSFNYGMLSPVALLEQAARAGIRKLAVTDINNTSAYIELLRLAPKFSISIVVGIEFRRNHELLFIAIAQNNQGFEEINRHLSFRNRSKDILPSMAPELRHTTIIYPWGVAPDQLRDNEWIGVKPNHLSRLPFSLYKSWMHKLVAWLPVTFAARSEWSIHQLLRCVDQNILHSRLDPATAASPDECLMPERQVMQLFSQFPVLVHNAKAILDEAELTIPLHEPKNKKAFTGNAQDDHTLLHQLAWEGFSRRYSPSFAKHAFARSRLQRELEVIMERNFEAYFLISHDIVQYAKRKRYPHVGRGSGANSMVAYCLQITDVDPVELDLYFERFLNPHRTSPPDFDIDFSWKHRDEVTNYIFSHYDPQHTALLATYTTFQDRSIIRELGKVYGLPKTEIDQFMAYPEDRAANDPIFRQILSSADHIRDFPRHLSIHAGGVVITEQPIYAFTATDFPPKGFPITHFDMMAAEDMGIHKYDILSQRGLGHIEDTIAIVKKNHGEAVDLSRFHEYKGDPGIRNLLRQGKAKGCFYVESPAMRMLLGKLECEDYITLVAASSIIRPGVARSGMMRAYIERHHMRQRGEKWESIHPRMDELMQETYGVMVYQEDVIKVAHHFAGLTLAEADILRRGMSGKYRSRDEFQHVRDKFFDNCREKGYPDYVIERVWFEIESFSGYSFSKAHSASYAVESYQSLYLKAHYPLEFMVGVINNFGGFYRTEFYFHEARMNGATIEAPCVNQSEYLTSIDGTNIHMGFIHLKHLERQVGEGVPAERKRNGLFKSFSDFMNRVHTGLEQVNLLIRIGAFRFTEKTKRELLWEARMYFHRPKEKHATESLFPRTYREYKLPVIPHHPVEDALDELELLEFPLCSPFLLLDSDKKDSVAASQLMERLGQQVEITGYLVTTKNTRTKHGDPMHFGTFLDRHGHMFDTTHFPQVSRQFPFRGKGFYYLRGKVVEDFGYPMVEVSYMEKKGYLKAEQLDVFSVTE